jgi:hypothetical protein
MEKIDFPKVFISGATASLLVTPTQAGEVTITATLNPHGASASKGPVK